MTSSRLIFTLTVLVVSGDVINSSPSFAANRGLSALSGTKDPHDGDTPWVERRVASIEQQARDLDDDVELRELLSAERILDSGRGSQISIAQRLEDQMMNLCYRRVQSRVGCSIKDMK